MGKEKREYEKWGNYFGGKMKSHLQSANEKSFLINLQVTVKSCYSFRKVVTFQKVVIFLIDTIFWKVVIFSKRHNFLDKTGVNRFHWTDMFLGENDYKRKSIFDFLITKNFSFSAFIFLSNKIKVLIDWVCVTCCYS